MQKIPTWSFNSPLALETMLPFLALNPFSIGWTLHESEAEQGGNYIMGKIAGSDAAEKIRIVRNGAGFEIEFWTTAQAEQQLHNLMPLLQATNIKSVD